ncbi:tRNA (adenosine(37)-N6)-threonylcarbamoyltransferase complex dimerization subunit type 1 TsaB [Zhihengliuella flava]|uniref:tRNA threonylcarbamoyl adenosine modification protein YeaZ n=1 Tax=Zhihengliuella flava TaxID=1285193 RepID=A0A931DAH0_9MICC|nr:tRNA (adenosine(37)-N6)-threonylcarbamoyltransferase complex dimerization subunit type 1 TsaB [Zhihengliuella flava]MBG6085447.1 tRNA threonylcarbamoyl adenosine modification protein YeaZ [Zhihengliuella flava]
MLLLAIDTSARATAALLRVHEGDSTAAGVQVLDRFTADRVNAHAEVLSPAIAGMLAEASVNGREIDHIVVGVGPGPFTGLRVGIATANALGFAWSVPVGGVVSLDAIAWQAVRQGEANGRFVTAIDARRRELYWGVYDAEARLVDGPHVGAAGAVAGYPVYGAGAGIYPEALAEAGATPVAGWDDVVPDAAALGAAAARTLAAGGELLATTPLYLRESDAKVPAAMVQGPSTQPRGAA